MVGPAVTVAQSIQDLCGCRWIGSTAHFYRYFLTDKNVTLFRGNVNDFLCKIRAFFAQCTTAPAIFAVLRSFRGRFNVKVPCIFAHSRFPSIITTGRAGGFLSTKKVLPRREAPKTRLKASQSSSPAGDEPIKIMFSGGVYVGEHTYQDASVRIVRVGGRRVHEAECNPFVGKARRDFSTD